MFRLRLCANNQIYTLRNLACVVACKSKIYFIYLLSSLFFFKRSISLTQLDRLLFTVERTTKKKHNVKGTKMNNCCQ